MDNKKRVLELVRCWNYCDFAAVKKIVDKGYIAYALYSGKKVSGIKGVIRNIKDSHKSFKGLKVVVEDIISEKNKVACRITLKSGKKRKKELIIFRLKGGKIKEAYSIGSAWQ